jgi:hypothetical protein
VSQTTQTQQNKRIVIEIMKRVFMDRDARAVEE